MSDAVAVRFVAGLLALALGARAAYADPPPPPPPPPLVASQPLWLFGTLNQHDTDCGDLGCGGTAALNGLVYLQNAYPFLYHDDLVPVPPGADPLVTWIDVANQLSGAGFMNTQCGANGCGTDASYFIYGKQQYFDAAAPATTVISAQSAFAWAVTAGGVAVPQPANFEFDPISGPTPEFIYTELKHGEAVEALLGMADVSHYVTVTGINYQRWDVGGSGTLSIIDPWTGSPVDIEISQTSASSPMRGTYKYVDESGTLVEEPFAIALVVGQSPIPEPVTWAVMLLGLSGVGVVMRMAPRRQSAAT